MNEVEVEVEVEVDPGLIRQVHDLTGMSDGDVEQALNAISKFTRSEYQSLRNLESRGQTNSKILLINQLIRRLPHFQGKIYRGLRFFKDYKFREFIENLKRDRTFNLDAMSSFTSDLLVAESYAISRYPVVLEVRDNNSGVAIEELAAMYAEHEVLAPRGTNYEVIDISPAEELGDITYIYLREIR